MRLRDLAGLIVIDFIDMDERRNNAAVEKKLKDKLKSDRARIQVGRISGFGLLEMSRQRLRPGMIEATTKGCPHCHGTGRVRSDDSIALALLRELEEEGVRARSKEVLIVAPVEIANYLLNQKREHIAMIEGRFGLSVRIEGDRTLISPDYRLERFKTASRIVQIQEGLAPTAVAYPDDDEIEETEVEQESEETVGAEATSETEPGAGEKPGGKRKRRRRRRGGAGRSGADMPEDAAEAPSDEPAAGAEDAAEPAAAAPLPESIEDVDVPKPKSRRRSRGRTERPAAETAADAAAVPGKPKRSPLDEVIETAGDRASEIVEVPESDAPQPRRRERVRRPVTTVLAEVEAPPVEHAETTEARSVEPVEAAAEVPASRSVPEPSGEAVQEAEENVGETLVATETKPRKAEPDTDADVGPKRRGWWSRAIGGS